MTDRVIPISDAHRAKPLPVRGNSGEPLHAGLDTRGRRLHDLRISVTDRCNFRCIYCMPRDVFGPDYKFLAREQLLSFEEIARLARIFKEKTRAEWTEIMQQTDICFAPVLRMSSRTDA